MMKKLIGLSLFFSVNCLALSPLHDNDLSSVSGQSGISIDLSSSSALTLGEVRYSDTDNGSLEKDGGGSVSLRNVSIEGTEFSLDIDVSNDGELIMALTDFGVMDISVDALQFNYDSSLSAVDPLVVSTEAQLKNQYSRVGSLAINDFTLAPSSDITVKFTNDREVLINASLPTGSFFYFTYIDDGEFNYDTTDDGDTTLNDTSGENYISTRVEFEDFVLNDVKVKAVGIDDDAYVSISLGGTQGAVSLRDININGTVIGSAGFENISVNPVSYLNIKGH